MLVGANWFRFRPEQRIHHPRVDSLCFVWAIHGSGRLRTGRAEFRMEPGWVLRLPWSHDVEYVASERNPFHLGTLHLIPCHDAGVAVEFTVAHGETHSLFDVPWRAGDEESGSLLLASATSAAGRDFVDLGTYCVERFASRPIDELSARALGVLVHAENMRFSEGTDEVTWPMTLVAMTDFVARSLAMPLTVADIAAVGACSPTTAQRLFGEYTGQSVIGWVRSRRMQEAARLLRTTGMRVNEVARAVGIEDPLYFSRLFRATYSVAPSKFINSQLRP